MTRLRIHPDFIRIQREKIKNIEVEPFEPVTTRYNIHAQWLIEEIATSGFTPKVEQLGAGVKRISIVGKCCPTCGKEQ